MKSVKHLLMLSFFLCLSSLIHSSAGEEIFIESVRYASDEEINSVWIPQENSPQVSLAVENERKVIKFELNFPEVRDRCYWDRNLNLDLSDCEKIILEIKADDPSELGGCTLYLQSEGGWYACGFRIERKGWQEIVLRKSQFSQEESPKGWNNITGIRISFWKPAKLEPKTTNVYLASIKALPSTSKVAIVYGDATMKSGSREGGSVRECFERMVSIFEGLDLDYSTTSDSEVEKGIDLNKFKILIFPYNPDITDNEAEEIVKFINEGGKVIIFYSLPSNIAKTIGIEEYVYRPASFAGEFSRVRFSTEEVDGLPEEMRQGSWNANIPTKLSEDAKIIGEWIDAKGYPTGLPAAILSPRGFYLGHILLNKEEGKQMILAILANLSPDLSPLIRKTVIANAGKIYGFGNFAEAKEFIEKKAEALPEVKANDVLNFLRRAEEDFGRLQKASNLSEIFKLWKAVTSNMKEAYSRCFESRKGEFRAVWCHSAFGVEGWSWDEAIRFLKENNIKAIFPNMLWGGLAYYPSEVLPVADAIKERGDQIAECLSACRKYGIECHIWKVNFNLANAPKEFVEKLRQEGRLQVDKEGKEVLWLCPSHPENFKLELESMLEVVRKYDVDGIHFDYIRYPNANSCYCEGCRMRFEEEKGVKVENWPQDVITGPLKELFADWRREQITKLVKAVSEEARKIKPSIKISAAVFQDYPNCREYVGQDWKLWVESGYLDFVCPMDYTDSNAKFETLVKNQKEIIKGKIPLYPGIGAFIIPVEQVLQQIEIARNLGADGFIIFNYDARLVEYLPFLSKGATETP
ncbi:family 10 glycosylhydrolase [bacterium]|nr:family 10 glycosylhydrolase [bacterium]